ncbi:MAG: plasmid recombination protein [Oscillospiraceae bacterium]|nr:plasmid recombination protein [Oscillospiraceae bacterium]
MAHVAKFKSYSLGHILRHYERGFGKDGKPIRYNNQSIDLSKSHLNYCLSPERDISQLEYVNSLIDKYCKRKRKDMVCMVSVVLTLPKNVLPEHEKEFFESAYSALKKLFVMNHEEWVISAYVHKDEVTPHLHFSFCPIMQEKGKNSYRFSAKSVVNRNTLQKLHPFLEFEIGRNFKKYGYTPQILTGELSTRKNLPIEKYKEYATIKTELETSTQKLKTVTQKYNEIDKSLNALLIEYQTKKEYLDSLNKTHDTKDLKTKKNKFTGEVTSVTIPIEIWESQKMLYADYLATKAMKNRLEKKITEIQEYLSENDKFDLEEKISNLTSQLAEVEAKNQQLELFKAQIHEVFHENPGLEEEYIRTQQYIVAKNENNTDMTFGCF